LTIVLSFDIDGTLVDGDPPGPITWEMVQRAKDLGFIIGSCSDRGLSAQKSIWEKANIEPHFTSPKHKLEEVKEKFPADKYFHIGDRALDEQFARAAGFDFWWEDDCLNEPWLESDPKGSEPFQKRDGR